MHDASAYRKRGNLAGLYVFKLLCTWFGLRPAYALVYFVGLYYLLFDSQAAGGAMAYVRRMYPGSGWPYRVWCVYMIIVNQGKCLIDRYALGMGLVEFEYEIAGFGRALEALGSSDKGAVLLTSHMGNWQASMTAIDRFGRKVNLLMRNELNEAVRKVLDIYCRGDSVRIIYTDQFLGGMVQCSTALARGELVSIMGDRAYGASAVEVEFLGGRAMLPVSAFVLAATMQCPLIIMFTARVAGGTYHIDMSNVIHPAFSGRKNRKRELGGWIRLYAASMESFAREHPLQWFLFEDIWKNNIDKGA